MCSYFLFSLAGLSTARGFGTVVRGTVVRSCVATVLSTLVVHCAFSCEHRYACQGRKASKISDVVHQNAKMLWCYANNAKALRPGGQALGCRRGPRWSLRAPSPESPAAAHIGQAVLDANQTRFAYLKVHNCMVAKYIV